MTIKNNKEISELEKPYMGYFVFTCFLAMESVGLFVQYVMGISPCSNCVLTRAFIALIGLSGMLIIAANKTKRAIFYHLGYFSCVLGAGGAFYFNHQNQLIESGKKIATCTTESPFPEVLPLDSILPSVFAPDGICGTPVYLVSNVTLTHLASLGLIASILISTAIYLQYIKVTFKK